MTETPPDVVGALCPEHLAEYHAWTAREPDHEKRRVQHRITAGLCWTLCRERRLDYVEGVVCPGCDDVIALGDLVRGGRVRPDRGHVLWHSGCLEGRDLL